MRKITTFLLCLLGFAAYSCTGGEHPIAEQQLPPTARQFLMQHFSDKVVANVTEETEIFSKNYEVWFVSGDKIEFDKNGAWTDVDCKYSALPVAVMPTAIARYMAEKYPTIVVLQIEHNKRGYEVTLANGLELKFNKELQLIEMDN